MGELGTTIAERYTLYYFLMWFPVSNYMTIAWNCNEIVSFPAFFELLPTNILI